MVLTNGFAPKRAFFVGGNLPMLLRQVVSMDGSTGFSRHGLNVHTGTYMGCMWAALLFLFNDGRGIIVRPA